ncbi:MAG TPA: type I-E CRISPR-associated endoribonuclease Cas2e [Chloroflexota bacterium]|nr:type I-E CRISPR-associated endoribonuclease Cas2e [Chloroflexota bacterium]
MVVLILERVPTALRGELTRWLLEPKTGVFVGRVSAMVRDKLWEHVCSSAQGGGVMLIHSADKEQGYALQLAGPTSRLVRDFEGLQLVCIP